VVIVANGNHNAVLEIGIEGHSPIHFVAAVIAFKILLRDD
jgi:hypothetical protein